MPLRMRNALRFVMLVCWLPAASYASAASINGVYALQQPGQLMPAAVLTDPDVDGVALRYRWDSLEPGEGRFDWSALDTDVSQAQAHGKKVSMIILPGVATPNWVYAVGAAKFPVCGATGRMAGNGGNVGTPVPWDPTYLTKWEAFVHALGDRYGQNPSLVLVKITGIGLYSGEFYLIRGGPCVEQDIANWQRVGFTRRKIVSAFDSIAAAFAQSFPNSKLAVMIVRGPMPPIDDNGNRLPGSTDIRAVQTMVMSGIRTYGSRFVVQNNALSAFWNWELLQQLRERMGAPIGYQMLWNATDDPHCRMNHFATPCDPRAILQSAINRGLSAGSSYLEIYLQDVENPALRSVIADAHSRLTETAAR